MDRSFFFFFTRFEHSLIVFINFNSIKKKYLSWKGMFILFNPYKTLVLDLLIFCFGIVVIELLTLTCRQISYVMSTCHVRLYVNINIRCTVTIIYYLLYFCVKIYFALLLLYFVLLCEKILKYSF